MLPKVRMARVLDAISSHRARRLSCVEAGELLGFSAATSQTLIPAQCVSSRANLSLPACLRPAMVPSARFNSCSVSIFACAIA